jgi:rhodanese-related sulfurtransferase
MGISSSSIEKDIQMKQLSLVLSLVLIGLLLAACSPAALPEGMISPVDYVSQYQSNNAAHFLLDVRTPEEYADGHIAGAVNIPLAELGNQLSQVPTDIPVVVYCRTGNRSAQAVTLLREAGYTNVLDMGGIVDWVEAGLPVE